MKSSNFKSVTISVEADKLAQRLADELSIEYKENSSPKFKFSKAAIIEQALVFYEQRRERSSKV